MSVEAICAYIRAHADQRLTLGVLARRAGLSPFHFQRTFKAATGVTPKQFQESCRVSELKQQLRKKSVTEAVYGAGFGSPSRVYERTEKLGMTPAQYGAGGAGAAISYASAKTALGWMMLGATDRGLCFVQFADTTEDCLELLRREYPRASLMPMHGSRKPQFDAWIESLREHLAGKSAALDLPLDVRATAFQMQVWEYLRKIPSGVTKSYAEVADAIGRPTAARAVARACATNRVAILIPCHRVLRGSGDLSGYKWGLARKRELLKLERA